MIEEAKQKPINESFAYVPTYIMKSGQKLKLRLCNKGLVDRHIREGYVYIKNGDVGLGKDDLHPDRLSEKTAIIDNMVVMGIPVEVLEVQLKKNKDTNERRKNKFLGDTKTSINKTARDKLHTTEDIVIGESFADENL